MIGSETKLTVKVPLVSSLEQTFKLELTASQTFSGSQGSSTENTQSQSVENSLQVALPPHTEVVLQQDDADIKMTINYDYPVAISYKVKTIGLWTVYINGTPSGGGALTELATFGRANQNHLSAVDNLYNRYINRAVQGYEATYGDGLAWDTLETRYETVFGQLEYSIDLDATTDYLYHNRPMSVTGGVLSVGSTGVSSKVYGISPLYPLSTIKPDGAYDYDMTTGDRFYVDNIAITGSNAANVPYYGFSSDYGQWILVDEAGDELHDSDIASLQTNLLTGNTHLVAGNTAGTVYLKYLINENVYSYKSSFDSYTKNSDLAQTAVIQVNVSPAPFDGKIDVSGSLTGYVGDPAINLDDCGLQAMATDSSGKELDRTLTWEAKELPSRGIVVEDNKVSFTKAGTFHIRASSGGVQSEWIEVTALPARVLNSLEIADNNSPSILNADIKNGPAVIDLEDPTNFITVNALDQYGATWSDLSSLEWKCDDANVAINGASLTVDTKGSYEIYTEIGGIKSNALILTVYDSSPVVNTITPHQAEMSSSGGLNTIIVNGENLPDTMIVAAFDAKGDEIARASASGTGENQTAALVFPPNTSADAEAAYIVKYSFDGTVFEDAPTAEVNVAKTTHTAYIFGYGGGVFGPDDQMTRAQAAQMLYNLMDDTSVPGGGSFTDVSADAWYYEAVSVLAGSGIISGYPDGSFGPDNAITRAEFVTMAMRFAGVNSAAGNGGFPDVDSAHWAAGYIAAAADSGYISGYPEGTFGPDKQITRAEAVTILNKIRGCAGINEGVSFTDVPETHWAYAAITAAATDHVHG